MNDRKQANYHAYLLRIWRETADLPWRATLEDPHTREKRGFASLPRLFAYLQSQTNAPLESPPESDDS